MHYVVSVDMGTSIYACMWRALS